jgi:hypothetical protein
MDAAKLTAILDEICQKVGGKWLLTGGALIQLQADAARATEDVDLVAISHETLSPVAAQNELFKAAIRSGLGPESVNSAAGFFVAQVPGWQNHLIEIQSGACGTIYRPSLTLFTILKLGRGTEVDLLDIAAAVQSFGAAEFDPRSFSQMASNEVRKLFEAHRKSFGL